MSKWEEVKKYVVRRKGKSLPHEMRRLPREI